MSNNAGWAYTLPANLSNALYNAIYFDGEDAARSAISDIVNWIIDKVKGIDLQDISNLQMAATCDTEDIDTCLTTLYDISDEYRVNLGLEDYDGLWYEVSCINKDCDLNDAPLEFIKESELDDFCDNLYWSNYLKQIITPDNEIRFVKPDYFAGLITIIIKPADMTMIEEGTSNEY